MKVVATMEEYQPVKVERYENDMKTGERTVNYLNFIDSLAAELPIGNLLNLLNLKDRELIEYLGNVTSDDIGTFESFMGVLCKELDRDLFESLPYWDVLIEQMSYYLSDLDITSVEGIKLLNRAIKTMGASPNEADALLFELNETLSKRLVLVDTDKYQKSKTSFMRDHVRALKTCDADKMREELEQLLPVFGSSWLQKMYRKSLANDYGNNVMVASSVVPKNCVLIQHYEQFTSYVIEIAKAQFRVKFHDAAFENVGHPRMLFIFRVNHENQIIQMKVVCIKENADISQDMPIYHYPFSNVFDNGRVCWNGLKEVNTLPLHQVANIFLSTANNSHLNASTLKLFQSLENSDFNDEHLTAFGNNGTLKDVL